MLGFFDSGLGGLTVLREAIKILPQYSYIYLADNARTPYGNRNQETIYQFTLEGVKKLFEKGAELIILACNTSSSSALRKIQQEFLPRNFPSKRVLGIIIPTAEEIDKLSHSKEIGIMATEATVNSLAYPKEINKIYPDIKVYQQACPLLVPIIEAGEIGWPGLDLAIEKYLNELFQKSDKIDTIILGCTHYAIVEEKIKKHLPEGVKIVSQGSIIAEKLKNYLIRHPEIDSRISKTGKRIFLTTEDSDRIKFLAELFYDVAIKIETIKI
ncbi:glutamate racemase [Candidatus Parcubacteria bacterium]|nr:glutamate racemase [Candidatus Parcubacteria bacterium]